MDYDPMKEFFQADGGTLSMTRLLMFLSFFPATFVILSNVHSASIVDLLYGYLGAYTLGYIGGKSAEMLRKKEDA